MGPPPGPPGQGGAFGAPQQGAFGAPQQQGAFGAPQQQGGFGAQPQGAFGAPQQPGAFGAQAQGAFGQPPPQHGAFGAAPQQGAFGSAAGFGAAPGAFGSQPGGAVMAPRKVGLFEAMPCPHCGTSMRSSAGHGATAGRMIGGLVGWMIISAIASQYYCPTHGEVPKSALPPEHQSLVTMRRLMMVGGAGALFVFAVGLMCVVSALRY
ncbi:MAG: hypothetical protein M5U28_51755 [Sandaracinaceae bacterium]|nr:hypothetical protein [Sandaracinaceae bacterium]